LHAPVRVVHQSGVLVLAAGPHRHLQRVEGQIGAQGVGDPPANDAPGEHVDDEGDLGEP
jgi:hypothetical protein